MESIIEPVFRVIRPVYIVQRDPFVTIPRGNTAETSLLAIDARNETADDDHQDNLTTHTHTHTQIPKVSP